MLVSFAVHVGMASQRVIIVMAAMPETRIAPAIKYTVTTMSLGAIEVAGQTQHVRVMLTLGAAFP
jgi:hypothetical protein